jgi:hypothetical protein
MTILAQSMYQILVEEDIALNHTNAPDIRHSYSHLLASVDDVLPFSGVSNYRDRDYKKGRATPTHALP